MTRHVKLYEYNGVYDEYGRYMPVSLLPPRVTLTPDTVPMGGNVGEDNIPPKPFDVKPYVGLVILTLDQKVKLVLAVKLTDGELLVDLMSSDGSEEKNVVWNQVFKKSVADVLRVYDERYGEEANRLINMAIDDKGVFPEAYTWS